MRSRSISSLLEGPRNTQVLNRENSFGGERKCYREKRGRCGVTWCTFKIVMMVIILYFQGSRPDCFGLIARSQAHTAAACLPLPKLSDYLIPILTTLPGRRPCEFPIFIHACCRSHSHSLFQIPWYHHTHYACPSSNTPKSLLIAQVGKSPKSNPLMFMPPFGLVKQSPDPPVALLSSCDR